MLLQTVIQGIPLDPLGMPQQTIGEMGLRMFNDAKAAISMGKMDGLLRRVRHLELRVKYCQHLHKTRKLSITHWKGEENPSDGLTKSLRPLSLWTNLVEAVGLVPGPTDQGSNWIRNYLNLIQQENELDTFLALPFVASKKGISRKNCWISRPSGPAIRGIQEGEYVSKTFWPCPSWVSKKGNHLFAVHDIITFLFSFVSSFITSWNTFMWCMLRMFCGVLWTSHPIFATGVS